MLVYTSQSLTDKWVVIRNAVVLHWVVWEIIRRHIYAKNLAQKRHGIL